MRISDWSSDVCSSDLQFGDVQLGHLHHRPQHPVGAPGIAGDQLRDDRRHDLPGHPEAVLQPAALAGDAALGQLRPIAVDLRLGVARSEEHTSELQSLMRISYAVFCLKKKKKQSHNIKTTPT